MSLSLANSAVVGFGGLNGYWGQFGNERLSDYCDTGIEYVTLAFVNQAPEHSESNYPGTNFAGHCWAGTYKNEDEVDSNLLSECFWMKQDINYCKSKGVKVLLSIGGEYNTGPSNYDVTTEENGEYFADFLYGAFGPYDPNWDGPRPFDFSATEHTSVDGFDFDIEHDFKNADRPWIAMADRFKALDPSLILSAAPQCYMGGPRYVLKDLIKKAKLDLLFIQFYNNPSCDAIPDPSKPQERFNYNEWVNVVDQSEKSKDAKIYIGLPASKSAAGSGYLTPKQLKDLVCQWKDSKHFGGVSLWDLTRGALFPVDGKTYYSHALDALKYGCDPVPTTTTTTISSTTSTTSTTSSTSTTSTTSTTSSTSTTSTTSETSTTTSETSTTTTETPTTTSTPTSTSESSTSTSETSTTETSTTETSTTETSTTETSTTETSTTETSTTETSTSESSTSTSSSTTTTFTTFHPPPGGWNTTTTTTSSTSTADDNTATITASDDDTITSTASDSAGVTTTSSARLTTSTAYITVTRTVTDCPVYVDCPEGGYVTTETIPIYTTICPVTETEGHPPQPTETDVPGGCDGDCPGDEPTDVPGGCDGDCPGDVVTKTDIETVTKPVDEPSVPTGGVPGGCDGDCPGEDEDDHVTSTTKVTTTVLTTITVSEDVETATTITKSYSPSGPIPTGGMTTTTDGSKPSHTVPVEAGASGVFVGLTTLSVALAMHLFVL